MANVHPIVSAMRQIKGDKPADKLARYVIYIERKAIRDFHVSKKTKKAIIKLIA